MELRTYSLVLSLCCWLLVGTPVLCQYAADQRSPVVMTTYGDVQGVRKALPDGSQYDQFLGIPFAAPPIGDNRFGKPLPPSSWNGTLDALAYGTSCTQIIKKSGEDCLYLNVFIPEGVDAHESPLPVMIYSYGGAYVLGSADTYPGQELAVRAKVVVVTYHYRVSNLGFLSTGDENSPGNYGLWDARAALIWVRDNIRAFGGDPGRVTAIGQSAGAAVSSHLVTSPLTKGLFHRVIAMSGGATSTLIGHTLSNKKLARNLGVAMVCPIWNSKSMVKCLRQKTANALDINGYIASVVLGSQFPAWIPVVDGDFVTQRPQKSWEEGAGSDIDLLVGSTNDDGAGLIYLNPMGIKGFGFNVASDPKLLELSMTFFFNPFGNATKLLAILKEQYPDVKSDDVLTRTKAVVQLLTDSAFASVTHHEASLHSKNTAKTGRGTYLYNFRYRQSFQSYAPWVNGSHVDDVWSLFGESFNSDFRQRVLGNFSTTDRLVSRHIHSYYGNFAHTGDPNSGPHKVPTKWPKYDVTTQKYMEQNEVMEVRAVSDDMRRRYAFWTVTWPKIINPDYRPLPDQRGNRRDWEALNDVIQHVKDYVQYVKSGWQTATAT